MSHKQYVHGYSERESVRLFDQAQTLAELLHHDSVYPAGSRILEAGCGTGAQTVILAEKNPASEIISMDISTKSLGTAEARIKEENIKNVVFIEGDIFHMPHEKESFDHVFVCFVLEHLSDPALALGMLKQVLKKGGSLSGIEGDHGSVYFYPESAEALQAIRCQIELQAMMKGNSLIGRRLYPLLTQAGFRNVHVSPRMVYADASRPEMVEGFTKKTFIAMIEGVKENVLSNHLISNEDWQKGIADLYRTTGEDGVFCYTFFKGIGLK